MSGMLLGREGLGSAGCSQLNINQMCAQVQEGSWLLVYIKTNMASKTGGGDLKEDLVSLV